MPFSFTRLQNVALRAVKKMLVVSYSIAIAVLQFLFTNTLLEREYPQPPDIYPQGWPACSTCSVTGPIDSSFSHFLPHTSLKSHGYRNAKLDRSLRFIPGICTDLVSIHRSLSAARSRTGLLIYGSWLKVPFSFRFLLHRIPICQTSFSVKTAGIRVDFALIHCP